MRVCRGIRAQIEKCDLRFCVVASKGPALAKRRNKLLQMCEIFPERKDFYVAQIEALDVALAEIQGCRRCRLIVAALDVQ